MASKTTGKESKMMDKASKKLNQQNAKGSKMMDDQEKEQHAGLHKQLRKTKFCMYHLQGACRFGTDCAFAHSLSEMHQTPDLRKTQLCKNFVEGRCVDKSCNFAHSEYELRSTDVFFKKTLCIWNEKGKCRNGFQCRFAHGIKDLRTDAQMDYNTRLEALGFGLSAEEGAPADPIVKPTKLRNRDKADKFAQAQAYPAVTQMASNDPIKAYPAFTQMASNDPIKVLPRACEVPQAVNMPPQLMSAPPQLPPPHPALTSVLSAPSAGQALEALQFELLATAHLAAKQQAAVKNAVATGHRSSLQMDLDDLRQSVAVLTSCCSRLQERVDLSNPLAGLEGIPAPAGLSRGAPALNYTGQYDPHDFARPDFGALTGGLQYNAGDFMRVVSEGLGVGSLEDFEDMRTQGTVSM
jgi:hypothetical protein